MVVKKLFIGFLLCFIINNASAQLPAFIGCSESNSPGSYFDSPSDSSNQYFIIDTSQFHNLWQIARSYKSSLGLSYGLLTDSSNSYPTNNVSSFKVGVITCDGIQRNIDSYWGTQINMLYSIQTDAHKDGVVLETSNNGKNNWRNILLDTNIYFFNPIYDSAMYSITDTLSSIGVPGFSGYKKNMYLSLFLNPPDRNNFDTTWFRFTFHSDSIQTNKAGFSLHSFSIYPVFEGINYKHFKEEIEINPNPSHSTITIKNLSPNINPIVEIYSIHGKLIKRFSTVELGEIDISFLEPGIYLFKTENQQKRIIKY